MLKVESGQKVKLVSEPVLKDTRNGGRLWKGFGYDLGEEPRTYIAVVAFDEKVVGRLAKGAKKGSVLEIEGGIRSRRYQVNGSRRSAYEVEASEAKIVK